MDLNEYVKRPAADIPLAAPRRMIGDWIVPFNNLTLLWGNLGLTSLVMAAGDFLRPVCRVFPWISAGCLLLVLFCLVVQLRLVPALCRPWSVRAVAFVMRPGARSLLVLLLLASLTAAAYGKLGATAGSHDDRGLLARSFPALQSLQDSVLGLNKGVAQANAKLDVVIAAEAAHQAAIAADPASLAVVNLAIAGVGKDDVSLRATVFLNAKLAGGPPPSVQVRTVAADGRVATVDLSDALAAAGGADAQLALKVPASVRHLTVCVGAPWPDAAHPHAVATGYDLDPANGATIAQRGKAMLISNGVSPCAA